MTPFLLENFCEKVLFVDFHKQSQKARAWQKWSFLRGQHQALLSVLSPQLWLGMPFMTNSQIPLILKGKTLLRWAPVRQAWSSAGIIYEKLMAQFLNTNRWEREKAGAWMKNIFRTPRSRSTECTQVYSVSRSSCLLVLPLIFQKNTVQNRYEDRQLRKNNLVLLLSIFHRETALCISATTFALILNGFISYH